MIACWLARIHGVAESIAVAIGSHAHVGIRTCVYPQSARSRSVRRSYARETEMIDPVSCRASIFAVFVSFIMYTV